MAVGLDDKRLGTFFRGDNFIVAGDTATMKREGVEVGKSIAMKKFLLGTIGLVAIGMSASAFAADLPKAEAEFMAASQVATSGKALSTPATAPAWKTKPSFAIVATQDRSINPDLERSMYARSHAVTKEIVASHAVYISQPRAVAEVIEQAAAAAGM